MLRSQGNTVMSQQPLCDGNAATRILQTQIKFIQKM